MDVCVYERERKGAYGGVDEIVGCESGARESEDDAVCMR